MRLKKGFTLAEILIVLMVIGVIATMTIPALMKGVTEAQYKTGYKKAYNTIVNLTAMERISGNLPTKATPNQVATFFTALDNNLSVKEYVDSTTIQVGDGTKAGTNSATPCATVNGGQNNTHTVGTTGDGITCAAGPALAAPQANAVPASSPWIVTEDGLAYSVFVGGSGNDTDCGTKADINAQGSATDAVSRSCAVVVVDVNGLVKGPNRLENQGNEQTYTDVNSVGSDVIMKQLVGDEYYIYVGKDGATSGNKAVTISGRIVSDLK